MAEFPALPLWTDAYIGDTQHLTLEEHGAYLKLLMIAWRSPDCSLPDDDKRLATMLGVGPKKWRQLREVIAKFFLVDAGRWTQKRLLEEREWVRKNSARQSARSQARWLKEKGSADAAAIPRDVRNEMPDAFRADAPTPIPTPNKKDSSLRSEGRAPEAQPDPKPKAKRAERLPEGATLPDDWRAWALAEGHPDPGREWAKFHDYWIAVAGQRGVKADWSATWRGWVRRTIERGEHVAPGRAPPRGGSVLVEGVSEAIRLAREDDERRRAAAGSLMEEIE